ncbi:MAG: UDP-N-acetylmuramate dehydrogenase [Nitrospirales bacterium]|nr:UDP-N-acetylmuramate dehydrogenase [Nitrospirales bacterium]
MGYNTIKEYCLSRGIEIRHNEPLARHTSLRIGGPADIALFPQRADLPDLIRLLHDEGIPSLVMGGGTNLLVRDRGVEGAVIFTRELRGMETEGQRISVDAGVPLQMLLGHAASHGLSGMEGLAGIPGSVGGAIYGNAGSHRCETGELVESLEIISFGEIRTVHGDEAGFRYRGSGLPTDAVILKAVLSLREGDPLEIRERIKGFLREKQSKQPVTLASAGCVFKNPEGISAGRLIEESGCKGMRQGEIEVSTIHANFFVNTGKGTASDFLRLVDEVRERVVRKTGVILEPEVRIIGRERDAQ